MNKQSEPSCYLNNKYHQSNSHIMNTEQLIANLKINSNISTVIYQNDQLIEKYQSMNNYQDIQIFTDVVSLAQYHEHRNNQIAKVLGLNNDDLSQFLNLLNINIEQNFDQEVLNQDYTMIERILRGIGQKYNKSQEFMLCQVFQLIVELESLSEQYKELISNEYQKLFTGISGVVTTIQQIKQPQDNQPQQQQSNLRQNSILTTLNGICYQCHQFITNNFVTTQCSHNYHECCFQYMCEQQFISEQKICKLKCRCNSFIPPRMLNDMQAIGRLLQQKLFANQLQVIKAQQPFKYVPCKSNNCTFFCVKGIQQSTPNKMYCPLCEL